MQIPYRLSHQGSPVSGGPVVKNLLSNAGNTGLIPGQGTAITHAKEQLSPHAATTEPTLQSPGSPTRSQRSQKKRASAELLSWARALVPGEDPRPVFGGLFSYQQCTSITLQNGLGAP